VKSRTHRAQSAAHHSHTAYAALSYEATSVCGLKRLVICCTSFVHAHYRHGVCPKRPLENQCNSQHLNTVGLHQHSRSVSSAPRPPLGQVLLTLLALLVKNYTDTRGAERAADGGDGAGVLALTFKDRHALENIYAEILEVEKLHGQLDDAGTTRSKLDILVPENI
jgi:hypothetical protein